MTIQQAKKAGILTLNTLPCGWLFIKDATTAPRGYKWAFNGANLFSPNYRHALIKMN